MTTPLITAIITGLAFLIIFITGYWLLLAGKPLNNAALTIHKLIVIATVVYLAFNIININKEAPVSSVVLTFIIISGILFLLAVITGGLLSIEKPMPVFITILHHVLSYLTVISTGAALFMMNSRKL